MNQNLNTHSPTDPLVEELLKANRIYCDANLLMPENFIEIITEYSAPDLTGFGTGKDEVVNSLQEYCLIALRAKEQIPEGIVYNYQNLNAKIIGEVGITDGVINFSFNIAGEKITLHPRLSVVYHFANDQWQAVHVHFSFPSSEQAEGESYPIDALKARNEELERLVAEKTFDLEQKNNELLVEVALEKVRSRTMAMQRSDELQFVLQEATNQLQQLGFKVHATNFSINLDIHDNPDMHLWVGAPGQQGYFKKVVIPYFHHPMFTRTYEAMDKGEELITDIFSREEKNRFYEYVYEHTDLKNVPEERKNYVLHAEGLARSTVIAKNSATTIMNFDATPYSKEENKILKRIAHVFDQAYTRFLDLQKAEAQAREAQIEAGLERVRAQAMAMKSSDELKKVVKTLFEQLTRLDVKLAGCMILTFNATTLDVRVWMFHPVTREPFVNLIPYNQEPFYHEMVKAWNERNLNWIYCLAGDAKIKWNDFLFRETDFSRLHKSVIDEMQRPDDVFFTASYYNYGAIMAASLEPFPRQSIDLIQRFSKVFDLSYTRFLDLEKAEEQAREAQIEVALERVRSRSLAMHHSNEMQEVVNSVFERLEDLEVNLDVANILVFSEDNKNVVMWTANKYKMYAARFVISYADIAVINDIIKARETGQELLAKTYSVEEKNELFNYFFTQTDFKHIPENRKKQILESSHYALSLAIAKNTGIQLNSYVRDSFSENENQILKRFAKVFEQTYIRFLDLQKAEAQAREAQIEVALERVRSRSMAMHESSDLIEVAKVMSDQLMGLGVKFDILNFAKIHNDGSWDLWLSTPDQPYPAQIYVAYFNHPIFKEVKEKSVQNQKFFASNYSFEEKNSFFQYLFENTDAKNIPESRKHYVLSSKGFARSVFLLQNIWLSIVSYSGIPFMDEDNRLIQRFANVFEQSYIRFLDLQKAEAQAREAQVEAALERVRSKAMAMHKSDDLHSVVATIFEQLRTLNLGVLRCGIGIFNEEKRTGDVWSTVMSDRESTVQIAGDESFDIHPLLQGTFDAWLKQKDFSYVLENEDLKNYYNELSKTNFNLPESTDSKLSEPQKTQYYYTPTFKAGNLYAFREIQFTDEDKNVLNRFAAVVSLTYNRFLDLQKAEAQAREAQIEVALERVRSRTMAMQKSEELSETTTVLFQQFKQLGENPGQVSIGIVNEKEQVIDMWVSMMDNPKNPSVKVPIQEPIVVQKIYNGWKEQKKSLIIDLSGNELKEYVQFRRSLGTLQIDNDLLYGRRVTNVAFFSKGIIALSAPEPRPAETMQLLERFAGVFDLTYTRFLDLQKAEAQAREAQIESALEKVRSRSLAMHSSNELSDVVQIVFEKLQELNFHVEDGATCILIFNEGSKDHVQWVADPGQTYAASFDIPYTDDSISQDLTRARENGMNFFSKLYPVEEKNDHFTYLFEHTDYSRLPHAVKELILGSEHYGFSIAYAKITAICIPTTSGRLVSGDGKEILKRFANVFDQAYTRFVDLQKAEAQAREAQIEAALERVRSKTMAMHSSRDVADSVATLFEEVAKLGIETLRCGIGIISQTKVMEVWTAKQGANGADLIIGHLDLTTHSLLLGFHNTWMNKGQHFSYDLKGDDLVNYFTALNNESAYPIHFEIASLPSTQFHNSFFFPEGALYVFSMEQLSAEALQIFKRFASVFGQTYRRYLDLLKAEAQAREAQIEAALERVRSRAMAMHKSNDLHAAVATVFEEFGKLNINVLRCGVGIFDNDSRTGTVWTTSTSHEGPGIQIFARERFDTHPLMIAAYDAWKNQQDFSYILEGKDLIEFYKAMDESELKLPGSQLIYSDNQLKTQYKYAVMFEAGALYAFRDSPFTEEDVRIMKRFASVFDLTYKRFLDLQKAEAQAREATIEAALERVRGKAMAMHTSDDVSATASMVFIELEKLSINPLRCGVGILNRENRKALWYSATSSAEEHRLSLVGWTILEGHPVLVKTYESWLRGEDYFPELKGDLIDSYYEKIKSTLPIPKEQANYEQYGYYFSFSAGVFYGWLEKPVDDHAKSILKRFASVIDLTFQRYFDLQKAEAQARDSQIEAALERVRGKAMAMHSSKDLSETINAFFKELKLLGIVPVRCGLNEVDEESQTSTVWVTTAFMQGDSHEIIGKLKLAGHPVLENIFEHWKMQQEYYTVLSGAGLREYYKCMKPQVALPEYADNITQYGSYFYFKEGLVYAWTEKELSEEDKRIFRRFAAVISLTYRRYMELQKSEANAKDAVRQASLHRIRAEIASMRTTGDLERITPLIWNELTILGVPFIRCGVFIMDAAQQVIHTFLSTPDGKAIAAFRLAFNTPGNISDVLLHWKSKKIYIDFWDEVAYTEFAGNLVKQGVIATPEQYLNTLPAGGFYLHFLPFLQGMLYVGNTTQLGEEEIKLIQSLADAFSTAYARYEDFNKLEAAKQQVDKTLQDLKQTQQQLIQSEKMASLGELTAGIAHEIQNPLNFVNNFSEVSVELIDEISTEFTKGNKEDVKDLAEALKDNLQKITEHGKRASSIVKGMLQHSRKSTDKKEPTDINELADEYVRLSYHGLRAKDKTFNAAIETDFDKDISSIEIIPQDIGRVLLNLLNNAFYSVNEKNKQYPKPLKGKQYEPSVSVTTKKEDGKVVIKVRDNGPGIPGKVVNKIFQPFFTTKPTGQGTGLGLSLSYDIIKAHGGEIKVETKEGVGAEFIIELPA